MLLHTTLLLQLLQWSRVAAEAAEEAKQPEGYYCYSDGHLHTRAPCRFFAIVMDAGSTGTRLQLYRFVHATGGGGLPFHAEQESFHEVKPGLSGFHGRPAGAAAASVAQLIEKARQIVPQQLWSRTPITLKATAGLRLLPGDAAQRILEEVNATVRASGFACTSPAAVSILDGADEGVHSWFTLNLLLASFYHDAAGNEVAPSPGRSAAAFDLGGGSTQVTFWPSSAGLQAAPPAARHTIDFFDARMQLYTKSYLGAGLQSARLGVLQAAEKDGEEAEEGSAELISPCFPADFHLPRWQQALREWSVRGSPEHSPAACDRSVRAFIRRSGIAKLQDVLAPSTPLYLFSYFFDRARQAGLVGEREKRVTVGDWRSAAERACSPGSAAPTVAAADDEAAPAAAAAAPHWLAWQCLDLTYIHALLTEGYGLEEDREIIPVNSIKGMGVSWALGMAYSLVDEYHRQLALDDVDDDDDDDVTAQDPASAGNVNATGVPIVDSLLTVISQKTTDVLQYFNLVS